MSEEFPVFLTTRKYRARIRERDHARAQLAEYRELEPYLGIAREIRREVHDNIGTVGEQAAVELATEWARAAEMRRLTEEYARKKLITLTEQQKEKIKQAFIEKEQPRIDKEVAEEVKKLEPSRRAQIERDTEFELRRLKREALLEKLGTDESRRTLERFGNIALMKAKHEALIEELKVKAETNQCVDLQDLPVDLVLNIGFGASSKIKKQNVSLQSCDRILTLRVLDPQEGILEVLDDSWMASEDVVRRGNALEDLIVLTMPNDENSYSVPRFSRSTEPNFFTQTGTEVNMYGLEAQVLTIGDQVIFG